jgi:hypothetical protein
MTRPPFEAAPRPYAALCRPMPLLTGMVHSPFLGLIGELRPGLGHHQVHGFSTFVFIWRRNTSLHALDGELPVLGR